MFQFWPLFNLKTSNLCNYCLKARLYAALLPNSSGCLHRAAIVKSLIGEDASREEDDASRGEDDASREEDDVSREEDDSSLGEEALGPSDLAGEKALIIRRLIVPLAVAVLAVTAGAACAQSAFPAPLPSQAAPASNSVFPPVNGAPAASVGAPRTSFPVTGAAPITGSGFERAPAPSPQAGGPADDCMRGFLPLREEAERRGKLIKAASERHAPPDEACKLIGSFGKAEINMIRYVETHSEKCGIPAQVADQLRNGHKNTEGMQQKVCSVAQQSQKGPAGPSLSEVLGSATALPEATTTKKGGSTFDTLNGNVLTR